MKDTPEDDNLIREAFRNAKVLSTLHLVRNAADAFRYLRRPEPHGVGKRPDLIVLDIAVLGGREFLEEVKSDPELRGIPVMVLSLYSTESDMQRAYDLHANCYVRLPLDREQYVAVLRSIGQFWLEIVSLPRD